MVNSNLFSISRRFRVIRDFRLPEECDCEYRCYFGLFQVNFSPVLALSFMTLAGFGISFVFGVSEAVDCNK